MNKKREVFNILPRSAAPADEAWPARGKFVLQPKHTAQCSFCGLALPVDKDKDKDKEKDEYKYKYKYK